MKPWQEAKKWHMEHGGEIAFEELLARFFDDGFVWSSPTEFVLAKACLVDDGFLYDGDVKENCYHVHLASGRNPMKRLMELAPKKLPYVSWHRRKRKDLHVYEWDKLEQKVKHGNND
jgi:hypothetical protein